jgi:hypothetical protein
MCEEVDEDEEEEGGGGGIVEDDEDDEEKCLLLLLLVPARGGGCIAEEEDVKATPCILRRSPSLDCSELNFSLSNPEPRDGVSSVRRYVVEFEEEEEEEDCCCAEEGATHFEGLDIPTSSVCCVVLSVCDGMLEAEEERVSGAVMVRNERLIFVRGPLEVIFCLNVARPEFVTQ